MSRLPIQALALALACTLCAWLPARVHADASEIIEARCGQLRDGEEVRIGEAAIASVVILPDFYEGRAFRPAWSEPRNLEALVGALREVEGDGLNPDDYHLSAIEELRRTPRGPQRDADLDMLATDAMVRVAYHLRFGKVDAERTDPSWNFKRDLEGLLKASPTHAIEQALEQERVAQALAVLRPAHPMYARLRAALAEYRRIAATGGWQPLEPGGSIRPGGSDARLPQLRERLLVEGDLAALPPEAGNGYDEATQEAVRRFQARHGLKVDGVVGGRTLRAFNLPVQSKIDRLRLSLERSRLILHGLPGRFVLVNVPAYRLYYADGRGGRFATNVVVGKLIAQTPIFRADMTHVVLNPTWTVPPGIMERDVIPGLKRDPDYLARRGLKRIGSQVVQEPGPNNALGRIKLMFPNPHLVYLHDTPQQDLFEAEARIFSGGCIRVQNVFELAELVLDDPAWSTGTLLEAAAGGATQTIKLNARLPVLLAYWTAAVGPDGRTYFYEDVYGRDPGELEALDAPFRFPREAVPAAG